MSNIIGIVNYESGVVLGGLSSHRTISAMNFLGRYRIIDFILSNMVNSGINNIKIMTKEKPRSLVEHLGSGSDYNINRKHGSLNILYSDIAPASELYNTDLYLMRQNAVQFEETKADYVVIAPSYMLAIIDYSDVVEQHQKSGADVTVVYKEVFDADENFTNCHALDFSGTDVKGYHINRNDKVKEAISMETYVMSKELFLKLLEASSKYPLFSLEDMLFDERNEIKIKAYKYNGYLSCINSFEQYYKINMSMIEYKNAKVLFSADWPIFTRTNDSQPTLYTKEAVVENSTISNGCIIQGTVLNSIVGRGVRIRKGAVIKDSIILPNAYISEDSKIEYAIIDKHAKVIDKKSIIGTKDNIAYIRRRDRV